MASIVRVPSWLLRALLELRIAEIPGRQDSPRVQEYIRVNGVDGTPDDDSPWCADFMNWVMIKEGFPGTRSRLAKSFLKFGTPLPFPVLGAVMVLNRAGGVAKDPFGHVTLYGGAIDRETFVGVGGNQGNRVSSAPWPMSRVVGMRWPEGASIIATQNYRIPLTTSAASDR